MLSYLSGNIDLGIAYYSDGNRRIYAYADSDFGSDESRRACADSPMVLSDGSARLVRRFHCPHAKPKSES